MRYHFLLTIVPFLFVSPASAENAPSFTACSTEQYGNTALFERKPDQLGPIVDVLEFEAGLSLRRYTVDSIADFLRMREICHSQEIILACRNNTLLLPCGVTS